MTQPAHHFSSLGPKGDKQSLPGAQRHPLHVQPASRSFPAIPQTKWCNSGQWLSTRAQEPEGCSVRTQRDLFPDDLQNRNRTCKLFSFPFKLLKIGIWSLYNAVLVSAIQWHPPLKITQKAWLCWILKAQSKDKTNSKQVRATTFSSVKWNNNNYLMGLEWVE